MAPALQDLESRLNESTQSCIPKKKSFERYFGECVTNEVTSKVSLQTTWSKDTIDAKVFGQAILPSLSKEMLVVTNGVAKVRNNRNCSCCNAWLEYTFDMVDLITGTSYECRGRRFLRESDSSSYKFSSSKERMLVKIIPTDHNSTGVMPTYLMVWVENVGADSFTLWGRCRDYFLSLFWSKPSHIVYKASEKNFFSFGDSSSVTQVNGKTWSCGRIYDPYLQKVLYSAPMYKFVTLGNVTLRYIYCQESCNGRLGSNYPLVVFGGLNAAAEMMMLSTIPCNFVEYCTRKGYDVYVVQNRCADPFSLEKKKQVRNDNMYNIMKYDIPAAIDHIRRSRRESQSVKWDKVHLIGFCFGGITIHGSILQGHLSPSHIASFTSISSSPIVDVPWFSRLIRYKSPVFPLIRFISEKILNRYYIPIGEAAHNHSFLSDLLHTVYQTLFRSLDMRSCNCSSRSCICNRLLLFSNSLFNHININARTHERLPFLYSSISFNILHDLREVVNCGHVASLPSNAAILKSSSNYQFPVHMIYGSEGSLFSATGGQKSFEWFEKCSPDSCCTLDVVEGYNHLDLIIGDDAHIDVFPVILQRLQTPPPL